MRDEDHVKSLAELSTDVLLLGLQISAGMIELPDCATLKQRITQLLEQFRSQAQAAGVRSADLDDATFALAAYLDEIIQYSAWPGRQEWAASPLQAILFSESRAGTKFFERLERVRRSSKDVLEVYYYCMTLGFMGVYRLGEPERLEQLVKDVRRELTRGLPKALSVHGERPDQAQAAGRSLPLLPIAGACLGVAVIVAAILFLLLSSSQSEILELLQQIGRS